MKGALTLMVIYSGSASFVLIPTAICVRFFCCSLPSVSVSALSRISIDPCSISQTIVGLFCQSLLDLTAQSRLDVTELSDFQNTTFGFTCVSRHLLVYSG